MTPEAETPPAAAEPPVPPPPAVEAAPIAEAPAAAPTGVGVPPLRPRLTSGQRSTAILGGLVGHTLFALGWFGFGFLLIGALASAVVGTLLDSLVGPTDSEAVAGLLARAGAIVWIVLLLFTVGALAFMALGVITSGVILKRGEVHRPWITTWSAVALAAIADIPAFWIAVGVGVLVSDSASDLVLLPFLIALLLVVAIGVLLWWWVAHLNRENPARRVKGREKRLSRPVA